MKPNAKQVLTHLDKIYWPNEGFTKGDVVAYYQKIAPLILPYLKNRPLSLNRHPGGIGKPGFFQKNLVGKHPAFVHLHRLTAKTTGKKIQYLLCQNKETLAYINNLGCIEINPWNSQIKSLPYPDYLVIDLDPERVDFEKVIAVAQTAHQILGEMKLKNYPKTSGGRGLHIYVPLNKKYNFQETKKLARAIVEKIHGKLPDITSLVRNPKKRQGKIYLDYLQNAIGQTLVAPYSLRPKPGAPVSAPLEWNEVKKGLDPKQFTIKTIFSRIKKKGDLFRPILGK